MRKRNKHQVFENIEIVDIGTKGKAVAKTPEGRVIFVQDAVPGDVVSIKTFKKRKGYFEGMVTKYDSYSSLRVTPVCEHFSFCGGCKWQHMKYDAQLKFKENEVLNNLLRIGKVSPHEIIPILGCDNHYFYRNKMEFSFSNKRWLTPQEIATTNEIDNTHACGFHIAGMWDKILDINQCHLQEEPSNKIRNFIKEYGVQHNLSFYNPKLQEGFLRTLMIRISSTGEIMVVIQFFENLHDEIIKLLENLSTNFPEITSLQYVINNKGNDTLYDQDIILFKGKDHILEEMEGLSFKIGAKSFYQTNSAQAYNLYKITRNFASLTGNEIVYDLYTGTGTIAQFVSKNAKHVVGVEAVPEAIEDAKFNAQLNTIANVSFYAGDMKDVFSDEFIKKNGHPDIIITDPPRDGMHKNVVSKILEIAPKKIVYVSCNAATQARDISILSEKYNVTKSQAVDMFPQTHHVENVVLLELKNR